MHRSALSVAFALAALGTSLPERHACAQDEPSAGAPPAASPSPEAQAPEPPQHGATLAMAHVVLDADDTDQTFHLVRRGFERLCTAPCEVDLPVGFQRFAVSGLDGKFRTGDRDVEIRDGTRIRATRETHGTMRALGIALLIVGPIASTALLVASVKHQLACSPPDGCNWETDLDPGLFWGGALLLPATVAPGILMVVLGRDRVRFELESGIALAPPPRDLPFVRASAGERRPYVPGLTARLRF